MNCGRGVNLILLRRAVLNIAAGFYIFTRIQRGSSQKKRIENSNRMISCSTKNKTSVIIDVIVASDIVDESDPIVTSLEGNRMI